MERVSITERPDWREKATEYGFNFHTMYGEPYWCEDGYYKPVSYTHLTLPTTPYV